MILLYDNNVTSATISAFSENPDYDFDTALSDTRLSRVGRTTDDASQWLQFSFTSAVDVDYVFILAHNITSGATVKIQANATDSWGSPSIDTAMTYNANYIYHSFSSTESYQYWRISIDDSSNPDTYIEIGYVFLGEKLEMPGFDPASIIVRNSNSVATKSISGQLYGDVKLKYKSAQFTFPNVTESEKDSINTFWETVDVVSPFLLLIWENSFDVEPPIYAALTKEIEWNKQPQNGVLWSMDLEFEETF